MAENEVIEQPINREVAGALAVQPHAGGSSAFAIAPRSMSDVMEFAKLMAVSGVCVRQHFRKNAGACLAVTLQAMKWGADPFAVANKAYVVNDQLAYEAQLVHAIVNSSAMLTKRLDAEFEGEGQKRRCRVIGCIKGDDKPREYLSPEVGAITTKNSPLWKSDPDQQLFYFSTRSWARRWVPDVLLGIYTPDELAGAINVTPTNPEPEPPRGRDIRAPEPPRGAAIAQQPEPESETYLVVDCDGEQHEFESAETASRVLSEVFDDALRRGPLHVEAARENNAELIALIGEPPHSPPGNPSTQQPTQGASTNARQPGGDAEMTDLLSGKPRPAQSYKVRRDGDTRADWDAWEAGIWTLINNPADPNDAILRDNREDIEIHAQIKEREMEHRKLIKALS